MREVNDNACNLQSRKACKQHHAVAAKVLSVDSKSIIAEIKNGEKFFR
jgi:hypothetical protein